MTGSCGWRAAFALGAAIVVAGCGDSALGPTAGSRSAIAIDLAPYFGAGRTAADACSEADSATLAVREEGPPSSLQGSSASPQNCVISFPVTVMGGPVAFRTTVWGADRALLEGGKDTVINTEPWSVTIPLTAIPSLEVLVTADTTAPAGLAVAIAGRTPSSSIDTVSVRLGVPDTIDALAAGPRGIALLGAANCQVMPPSADTVVDIPTDSTRIARALFSVTDCTGPPADSGAIKVVTTTMGSGGSSNYFYSLDSGASKPIGVDTMIVIEPVAVGSHTVELSGFQPCVLKPATVNPQDVTVTSGDTAQVLFEADCTMVQGAIRLTTMTTNPLGFEYPVTLDGLPPADPASATIGEDATVLIDGLAPADYAVGLTDVTPCTVQPPNPVTVTVSAGDTASLTFQIDCTGVAGAIEVTTVTTSPAGFEYTFSVDGGPADTIGENSVKVVDDVVPGSRVVALADFTPCGVTSANPQFVVVASGDTARVSFDVDCSSLGAIEVVTSTMGAGGPAGYSFFVDASGPRAIGASDTVVVSNLGAGSHTVDLTSFAPCTVTSPDPVGVMVPAGDTVRVTFDVDCSTSLSLSHRLSLHRLAGLMSRFTPGREPLAASLVDPRRRWWYAAAKSSGRTRWST
jgi:hypothetical protein